MTPKPIGSALPAGAGARKVTVRLSPPQVAKLQRFDAATRGEGCPSLSRAVQHCIDLHQYRPGCGSGPAGPGQRDHSVYLQPEHLVKLRRIGGRMTALRINYSEVIRLIVDQADV